MRRGVREHPPPPTRSAADDWRALADRTRSLCRVCIRSTADAGDEPGKFGVQAYGLSLWVAEGPKTVPLRGTLRSPG